MSNRGWLKRSLKEAVKNVKKLPTWVLELERAREEAKLNSLKKI